MWRKGSASGNHRQMDLGEGDAWRGSGKNLEKPSGWVLKTQKVDGGHLSTLLPQGGRAGRDSQTLEWEGERVLKIFQTWPLSVLAWGEVYF